MKISKSKFGILEKVLKRQDLLPVKSYPEKQDIINQNQGFYSELFKIITEESVRAKTITYVSEAVRKAFDENPKVATKMWELRNEVESSTGILLVGRGTVYMYSIENSIADKKVEAHIFTFQNDVWMSYSEMFFDYDETDAEGKKPTKFYKNVSFDVVENEPNYNVTYPLQMVVSYLLFKKYAEHEIKLSDGIKVKHQTVNDVVYQNELSLPINIFDSRWFTTFVKSEAFKVSGHFKLQPCGPAMQNRKLIWVNEYTKHGMARPAKMLSEDSGT